MLPFTSSMDQWRAFFAQADSDLWTIIDQAILLAASDFPEEFKHKRCEIAETLFAKRSWPPERSIEATMLSGSVVTNATAFVQEGSHHHICGQEADTSKHVQTAEIECKAEDTYSLGSDSKASAVDRLVLGDDYRSAAPDTCVGHRDGFKGKTTIQDLRGVDMDHTNQQKVSMIKDKIMDSSNQSDDEILQSLKALDDLHIDVKILKATDVGRAVNKFRKHSSVSIRNLSKQLVRTWKGMVDEWVNSNEDEPPVNVSATQGAAKLETTIPSFQGNPSSNSTKMCMQMPKQHWLQPAAGAASIGRTHPRGQAEALPSCNDDINVQGRKLYGEHIREEMGSSRVESDEIDRPGTVEKRKELSGYPAQSSRCIVTKGSSAGSGPGRPMSGIPELKRGFVSNDVVCEHRKDLAEKGRRTQNNQGDLLQKNGLGKSLVALAGNQKVMASDHLQAPERHEVLKRRLPIESQSVENAKKQRDVLASSRVELSKGLFGGTKVSSSSAKAQLHVANKW